MVAIAGDHLVAVADGRLHARHHGLLADIEVTEAGDMTHAVELSGTLFKAPDEQHHAVEFVDVVLRGALERPFRNFRCLWH